MFSLVSAPNGFLKSLYQKEQETSNLTRTKKVMKDLNKIENEPALEPEIGCCDRVSQAFFNLFKK